MAFSGCFFPFLPASLSLSSNNRSNRNRNHHPLVQSSPRRNIHPNRNATATPRTKTRTRTNNPPSSFLSMYHYTCVLVSLPLLLCSFLFSFLFFSSSESAFISHLSGNVVRGFTFDLETSSRGCMDAISLSSFFPLPFFSSSSKGFLVAPFTNMLSPSLLSFSFTY